MKQNLMVIVALGFISGCGGYNSYPGIPRGGYGYEYGYPPPVNYGYGYGYTPYSVPAYGYYPGPVYYGRPYGGYGGYGYPDHAPRPPISNNQKALNFIYDHRNQIQRLPPQQQQQILRQAQKLGQQNNNHRRHHSN